jgi:hypothetical protein
MMSRVSLNIIRKMNNNLTTKPSDEAQSPFFRVGDVSSRAFLDVNQFASENI